MSNDEHADEFRRYLIDQLVRSQRTVELFMEYLTGSGPGPSVDEVISPSTTEHEPTPFDR